MSDAERAGAEAFERFLAERITPELAARRPASGPPTSRSEPVDPISTANGADPAQPERTLSAARAAGAGDDPPRLAG